MDQILLLKCKYKEMGMITEVVKSDNIDRLIQIIRDRWCITQSSFIITYDIPGLPNCELKNELDYKYLFQMALMENLSSVNVTVHDHEITTADNILLLTNHATSSSNSVKSGLCAEDDPIEDECRSFSMSERWKDCITGIDQIFTDGVVQLRRELAKFAVYHGFKYDIKRNTKFRFAAVCINKEKGCNWELVALGDSGRQIMYTSKYNGNHSCGAGAIVRSSERLSADMIAQIATEKLRFKPNYKAKDLQGDMFVEYACKVSYALAWNGLQKAIESVSGDYRHSYDQLKKFVDAVSESNPGSKTVFEVDDETRRFKRLFVSFNACIKGFEYIRPVLFLDSTFLKGKYRGQMLAATGKDGNNHLFNLAFAIVDIENKENWTWFCRNLKTVLNPNRRITFVSDRHPGILDAVSTLFPLSPHGYCTVHLERNIRLCMPKFSTKMKDIIVSMFKRVTYATTREWYDLKLEEMKKSSNVEVHKFLDTLDPIHYCHAFFPGARYGELTSNAAESLNNKFKIERQLQLISLVDGIRTKIMNEMTKHRDASAKWKFTICPAQDDKIRDSINFGKHWAVLKAKEMIYEVKALKSVMVDLINRTCTCNSWQLDNFPCAHALVAIQRNNHSLLDYIDHYYHVENFIKTYAEPMLPISTLSIQPPSVVTPEVLPPLSKSQPGRKRKNRFKEKNDSKLKKPKLCSLCRKEGHTRRKCQA